MHFLMEEHKIIVIYWTISGGEVVSLVRRFFFF